MNEVTKGEDWQVVVTFCLRFLYGSADKLCRHRQPICYLCFFVFPWLPIVAYLLIRPGKFARPHEVREPAREKDRLRPHAMVLHKTCLGSCKIIDFQPKRSRRQEAHFTA